MGAVFNVLYAVHPVAPLVFLLVMANGVLAPAVLHACAGLPLEPSKVRALAKSGNTAARYSYYSWLVLAAATAMVLLVIVTAAL